jgi:hypothetical protein
VEKFNTWEQHFVLQEIKINPGIWKYQTRITIFALVLNTSLIKKG